MVGRIFQSTDEQQVNGHSDEPRFARVVKGMTIAGITLLLSFVGAVLLITTSPSDSGQRGAGHGALFAASWLTVAWVIGATGLAILRWRATGVGFRAILVVNAVLVCLLLAQFWFH